MKVKDGTVGKEKKSIVELSEFLNAQHFKVCNNITELRSHAWIPSDVPEGK